MWQRAWSSMASRRRGCGTESKCKRTRCLPAGVSSAVGGATSRTSVTASANGATAQAITAQATTSAMWRDAMQSRDHSVATCWRSALIAKKITSHSAAGA